jgi:hypothetical protein
MVALGDQPGESGIESRRMMIKAKYGYRMKKMGINKVVGRWRMDVAVRLWATEFSRRTS